MQLYLKNLFSNKERHALEKKIMQDPFETEAFEGLSELSAKAFETDIEKLQSQLSKRTKKRKLLFLQQPYAIAASILFLIGLSLTMFFLNKTEEPYQIVTNSQELEDAVVVNESVIEKEGANEILFQEPDYSLKDGTIVDYKAIDEYFKEEKKPETTIEKPVFSKEMLPTSAKVITADADLIDEVEEEQVVEVFEEEEVGFDVEESKTETEITSIESPKLETWSGTITDNYGMPLPGVNVVIKGTNVGIVTDFDGSYTIQVPKDAKVEANYLGFENTDIAYELREKVVMNDDKASLEEVLVVGYGTSKKRKAANLVENVKGRNLSKEDNVSVDETLKGRMAGVKVSSAKVNSDILIRKSAIAPQGSDDSFKQWIMTQLDPSVFEKGKEYSIDINFVIDQKGEVSVIGTPADLKLLEKKHLKTIFESSSNWTPAQNRNGTVKESKLLVLWFHF